MYHNLPGFDRFYSIAPYPILSTFFYFKFDLIPCSLSNSFTANNKNAQILIS